MVDFFTEAEKYHKTYMYLLSKDESTVITESGDSKLLTVIKTIFAKIKEFIQKIIRGTREFFIKLKTKRKKSLYKKRVDIILKSLYNIPKTEKIDFPDFESMRKHMTDYISDLNKAKTEICHIKPLEWADKSISGKAVDNMASITDKYMKLIQIDLNKKKTIQYSVALVEIKDIFNDPCAFSKADSLVGIWDDFKDYIDKMTDEVCEIQNVDESIESKAGVAIDELNNFRSKLLIQYDEMNKLVLQFEKFSDQLLDNLYKSLDEQSLHDISRNLRNRDIRKLGRKYDKGELDPLSNKLIKDSGDKILDDSSKALGNAVYKLADTAYKALNNGKSFEDDEKEMDDEFNQHVQMMNNKFMNAYKEMSKDMKLGKKQEQMLDNMMTTMNNMTFSF